VVRYLGTPVESTAQELPWVDVEPKESFTARRASASRSSFAEGFW